MSFDTKPLIAAGIAFLDERVPDWPSRIDLKTLVLSDGECCMLAQATGSTYPSAKRRFGITDAQAAKLGFFAFDSSHRDSRLRLRYAALTAGWRDAVNDRCRLAA